MSSVAAFERLLPIAEARRQSAPYAIVADIHERAAVARQYGLVAVDRLEARLDFAIDGTRIAVTGPLTADVVQRCVATDEPLAARVTADIDVRYVPNAELEAAEADAEVELGADDLDIIGYAGQAIDLGAMVAETLYLALDPYPRSPDADAWLAARGVKSEEEAGAFGALASLRATLAGETSQD